MEADVLLHRVHPHIHHTRDGTRWVAGTEIACFRLSGLGPRPFILLCCTSRPLPFLSYIYPFFLHCSAHLLFLAENSSLFQSSKPRICSHDFKEYRGRAKAISTAGDRSRSCHRCYSNDEYSYLTHPNQIESPSIDRLSPSSPSPSPSGDANHYMKAMQRPDGPQLLKEYARVTPEAVLKSLDGRTVMGDHPDKSIYWIINGTKRAFPDFNTFLSYNISQAQIRHIKSKLLNTIPLGPSLTPFKLWISELTILRVFLRFLCT